MLYESALTKAKSPLDASASDAQAENEEEGTQHNDWAILGNNNINSSSFHRQSIRRRSTANTMRRKVCFEFLLCIGTIHERNIRMLLYCGHCVCFIQLIVIS
jgi:hypothetical protein